MGGGRVETKRNDETAGERLFQSNVGDVKENKLIHRRREREQPLNFDTSSTPINEPR